MAESQRGTGPWNGFTTEHRETEHVQAKGGMATAKLQANIAWPKLRGLRAAS
jgi:hypothetical protein